MTFFGIFQKVFRKLEFNFFSSNFAVASSLVGAIRGFSGSQWVANRATKYDCSNLVSFPDMMFFLIFSQIFSDNTNYFFSSKLEIPNLVGVCCQSTLSGCESCLQIWLLKPMKILEI